MSSPKSKWVNGALVYYDDANESRWLDAIGTNVRKWEMRYGSDFTSGAEYTVTAINSSTMVQAITAGARALITTDTAKWDSINCQVVGTPFQLATGKPCYFGIKMSVDSETLSDFFVGLCSTDTTIITAGGDTLDVGASCAGLYALKSAVIYGYNEIHANSASTASGVALDTNSHIYEFMYDGAGGISYWVDGTLVGRHTTYIPTVVMAPSVALKCASAAARAMSIDWMRCIQIS